MTDLPQPYDVNVWVVDGTEAVVVEDAGCWDMETGFPVVVCRLDRAHQQQVRVPVNLLRPIANIAPSSRNEHGVTEDSIQQRNHTPAGKTKLLELPAGETIELLDDDEHEMVKIAAVSVVDRGERALITLRSERCPQPFHWQKPGGKIEAGESAREAACRELHEETTILATPNMLEEVCTMEVGAEGKRFELNLFALMEDSLIMRQPQATEEMAAFRWVACGEELPEPQLPSLAPCMRAVRQWLRRRGRVPGK